MRVPARRQAAGQGSQSGLRCPPLCLQRSERVVLHSVGLLNAAAMTLALEPSAHDFAALQAALGKKQSFVGATQQLAAALNSPAVLQDAAARAAVARCFAVLRARYTSRAFWLEGRQLFKAAAAAAATQGDTAFAQQLQVRLGAREACGQGGGRALLQPAARPFHAISTLDSCTMNMLQGYVREANAFLEDVDEDLADASGSSAAAGMPPAAVAAAPPGSGRSGSGFLFEGQLSGAEPPPRQPDLMSLLGSALGQQLAAAQAAAQQQQQQPTEGGEPAAADQQQQAAAAAGPPPEVLEAIERELDAIAVQVRWPAARQLAVLGIFLLAVATWLL